MILDKQMIRCNDIGSDLMAIYSTILENKLNQEGPLVDLLNTRDYCLNQPFYEHIKINADFFNGERQSYGLGHIYFVSSKLDELLNKLRDNIDPKMSSLKETVEKYINDRDAFNQQDPDSLSL